MMFNDKRKDSRNGMVTRLSGAEEKDSKYTLSAGDVHSKLPPVDIGTLNSFAIIARFFDVAQSYCSNVYILWLVTQPRQVRLVLGGSRKDY